MPQASRRDELCEDVIEHGDGARDVSIGDGRLWRYDPSGRLTEIVDFDGAATVFDEDGMSLRFDGRGDFLWMRPCGGEPLNAGEVRGTMARGAERRCHGRRGRRAT